MSARRLFGALFLAALVLPTMARSATTPAKSAPASTKATTGKPAPVAKVVLPFIDDDYEKARNEARQRKIPIFIENWAPW